MKHLYVAAAVALAGTAAVRAEDAPMAADAAARAFGAREFIQQISLSPDGGKVAIVSPNGARGTSVMVADPLKGGAPLTVLRSDGNPERIQSCGWVTDTRLVCEVYLVSSAYALKLGVSRLIAINSDGTGMKLLSARTSGRALGFATFGGSVLDWQAGGGGSVLLMSEHVPESTIGTRLASDAEGLGVERVDAVTLRRGVVEPPREQAVEYISDGRGNVRLMGLIAAAPNGQLGDQISYSYRKADQKSWQALSTIRRDVAGWNGFNPYAVDPASDAAYGFDRLDGRKALYRMALDGSLKKELVLAHPEVDVDGLVTIGRQHRVVGASYATDVRTVEFFDPELHRLREALGKALHQPTVSFTDASADEKTLLVYAGGDTDPGRYYLFRKGSREMTEVLAARPQLAQAKLGTVQAVRYPAADGTMIPAYLTLPAGSNGRNLPAIVMPHGGPSARDEWGFDWLSQFFVARGFAVLQPNYRGSSGYGAEWFQKNGFQSWRTAIGDVNDAGRWLQSQGIAAPGKLAIVGWSYGGYAALQSPALDGALFKAIVAVAPVTDLPLLKAQAEEFTNRSIVARYIGSGAHLREGSPAQNVAAIKAPVLIFHGDDDLNVEIEQSRLMARRLRDAGKPVELVEFKGLDHQLEDSDARTQMLEKSDAFLRTALGM